MDYAKLKTELQTDPLIRGYAAMSDEAVAADGAQKYRTRIKPGGRRCDERIIMAEYGNSAEDADAVLKKIETIGGSNSLFGRMLKWLAVPVDNGGGLDLGNVRVRLGLDRIVGQGGVTKAMVDGLKALAEESCTRWEELGLGAVNHGDVAWVRREMI